MCENFERSQTLVLSIYRRRKTKLVIELSVLLFREIDQYHRQAAEWQSIDHNRSEIF